MIWILTRWFIIVVFLFLFYFFLNFKLLVIGIGCFGIALLNSDDLVLFRG